MVAAVGKELAAWADCSACCRSEAQTEAIGNSKEVAAVTVKMITKALIVLLAIIILLVSLIYLRRYNWSSRALGYLQDQGIVFPEETRRIRQVPMGQVFVSIWEVPGEVSRLDGVSDAFVDTPKDPLPLLP